MHQIIEATNANFRLAFTVNLVKLATGRGELVATKWENMIEVTCNNSPEFCLLQVLLN